jgi:signal transduction histidine kinase
MMYSDRAKLGQILRNLLSNAIKYTNEGTVTLSVALAEDEIVFSVTDTGVGIAPEELEQVFRHFVQASPAERPAVEGTGLGLPLSRQLAHLLGGQLTAESQPGVGSTFRLTVPVRVGEHDEPSTGGTDASNGSGLPSPGQARAP